MKLIRLTSVPQLDVFLDTDDVSRLVGVLKEHSCYFVPDVDFSYPSIDEWKIENADEFLMCREQKQTNLFFALSENFVRCPLEFRKIEKAGKTVYFIGQKAGGPTLDLFLPRPFTKEGKDCVSSGFIGYHTKYWNTSTEQMETAPDALKSLYNDVSRTLRKSGEVRRGTKRTYIVGPHTSEAAKNGLRLTNPDV